MDLSGREAVGYIRHHAICVTSWCKEHLDSAHTKAVELGMCVTPVTPSKINGYLSFMICPDGSKEGWDASDTGDQQREDWKKWALDNRDIIYISWVEVQYGDENGSTLIVSHSDEDITY